MPSSGQEAVPIYFSYLGAGSIEPDAATKDLEAALGAGAERLRAAGWQIVFGEQDVIRILFGPPELVEAPRVMMDDGAAAARAATASEDLQATLMTAERGNERLSVSITQTETDLSQVWKGRELAGVELRQLARGRAAAVVAGVVVDTGRRLVRLSYSEGTNQSQSRSETERLMSSNGSRAIAAREILKLAVTDD